MPGRKAFGELHNDELPLVEAGSTPGAAGVRQPRHGGDAAAATSRPSPTTSRGVGLDDFRCTAVVTTPVDANWKVVVDGFSETYHIPGLHPEMVASIDDVHTPQVIWGHTGKSAQDYGVPSPAPAG